MLTLFVDQIFPERLIKALCWTLVHSLWQGLALTIVTGTLILLTRRSGARIRYGLFSAAFLLFLVVASGTFAWQWNKLGTSAGTVNNGSVHMQAIASSNAERPILAGSPVPAYQVITERLTDYFNEHASLIVTIWFIIFSARLVRILGGLGRMQRIRHYRTHTTSAYWTERVNALAGLLHIKIPVTLLESELIKAPMMMGVFKPVILLPLSLLSQLPAREVEAILLHELAHIRRKDYLINLLQSFAEIIFFFNPGVWWISSLIREERENCCDDIAVGLAGNKKEFIHALVSFQDYGTKNTKYAISLRGAGNHLLQRVRRILYQDDKILDGREKFFLGCSLVVMLALALTLTPSPAARGAGRYLPPYAADAAFDGRIRIASDSDTVVTAKRVRAVRRTAAVRPVEATDPVSQIMSVDTLAPMSANREEAARREELAKRDEAARREGSANRADREVDTRIDAEVNALIDATVAMSKDTLAPIKPIRPKKIVSDSPEMMEKIQRDQEMKQLEWKLKAEEWKEDAEKWERAAKEGTQGLNEKQRDELETERKKLADQQQVLAERERELVAEQRKLVEQEIMLNKEAMEADQRLRNPETMSKLKIMQKPKIMSDQKIMQDPKISKEEYERPERPERPERKEAWERPEFSGRQKLISPIIKDLLEENLISDPEEFSFELNGKEMKVNGHRQPDEVYKRFAEKYIKDPKSELNYSRKKNGSESIHINVN